MESKIHANVCRRGIVRYIATWRLLKMVGRQPVIIGTDILLEKRPGAPGQALDFFALRLGERAAVCVMGWLIQ